MNETEEKSIKKASGGALFGGLDKELIFFTTDTELKPFEDRRIKLHDEFVKYRNELTILEKLDKGCFEAMRSVFYHLHDEPVTIDDLISNCISGSTNYVTDSKNCMTREKVMGAVQALKKRKYIKYNSDNTIISIRRDIYIDQLVPKVSKTRLKKWVELKLLQNKVIWRMVSNENDMLIYCNKNNIEVDETLK